MIVPIERINISEQVFQKMLELIANKTWSEGDRIPSENELKDLFQVSRNTVRQSIHKLAALGIIESKQGEGTFVKRIDTSFYLNILVPTTFLDDNSAITVFEYEKSIQVESAKLAAVRATDEEIHGLADFIDKMKQATDPEEFFDWDNDYHIYLAQITHNAMFYKSMMIIKSLMRQQLSRIVTKYGTASSIQFHERIYEALCKRDGEKAGSLMDAHMAVILRRLDESY